MKFIAPIVASGLVFLVSHAVAGPVIGNHVAVYDASSALQPWAAWDDIIQREVNWYSHCPVEHGYPRFVYVTFMDGDYQADTNALSFIPAMQDGMGILSYLKYYTYKHK